MSIDVDRKDTLNDRYAPRYVEGSTRATELNESFLISAESKPFCPLKLPSGQVSPPWNPRGASKGQTMLEDIKTPVAVVRCSHPEAYASFAGVCWNM